MGFDMEYKIFGIGEGRTWRIITDIRLSSHSEWLRDLKRRWEDDTIQQQLCPSTHTSAKKGIQQIGITR